MSSMTHLNLKKSNTQLMVVVVVVLSLLALGFGYYRLHHYSVDNLTMTNPTYGLQSQKPISSTTPNVSKQ
jgi:hypothetical protein